MFDHLSLLNKILESKWAITSSALEQIIRVVMDDYNPKDLASAMHGVSMGDLLAAEGKFDFNAISSMEDEHLGNSQRSTFRDGVAIIPVVGPIFPRANLMTSFSGATSISSLAKDLRIALDDSKVHSIVFNMDSPGGEITGVSEFAQMIYAAREKKKCITYVYGWGASAGYWIGSASDELVIADTAEVGSIGVVAGYTDDSEALKKRGYDRIEIVSSQSPNKRLDPKSSEGRRIIQESVDQLATIFINAVAKHRGTDAKNVLENFGHGGMIGAAQAVELGMADRIGNLESIIAEQIDLNKTSFYQGGSFMAKEIGKETESNAVVTMTVEALRENHVDVYNAVHDKGKREGLEEGARQERERIQTIESLSSIPGSDAVIVENKFKAGITKDQVASLILTSQEQVRKDKLAAMEKETKDATEKMAGVGLGSEGSENADQATIDAAVARGANSRR